MIQFLSIFLVWLVGLVLPGPDFAMNLNQSLSKGRKAGLFTSVGFGLGILVHCSYCLLGIGVVISKSILLFDLIKILGGTYLIYLGIVAFFAKNIAEKEKSSNLNLEIPKEKWYKSLQIGFFTDVLNPKTTVLILSLFTQIIDTNTSFGLQVLYAFSFSFSTTIWHSFVAVIFSVDLIRAKYNKFKNILSKVFGVILIGLGVKIITTNK